MQFAARGAERGQRVSQSGRARFWPRAAQHRALKRRDGQWIEPAKRMLEQGQQRHRGQSREDRFHHQPCEHAGRRFGQIVAGGIVGLDIPARQRRQHAAGERAVGRDQRGGFGFVLDRLAEGDRNGERFFLGIGRFDHGDIFHRRLDARRDLGQTRAPAVRPLGRAHCFRDEDVAPLYGGEQLDRGAVDAETPQQRGKGELRMAGRRVVFGQRAPGVVIEFGIEAG